MDTVKVDDQLKVRLPGAKPGQVFSLEDDGGVFTLTPLKKAEDESRQARLVKRGRYTQITGGPPISTAMVRQMLEEFP